MAGCGSVRRRYSHRPARRTLKEREYSSLAFAEPTTRPAHPLGRAVLGRPGHVAANWQLGYPQQNGRKLGLENRLSTCAVALRRLLHRLSEVGVIDLAQPSHCWRPAGPALGGPSATLRGRRPESASRRDRATAQLARHRPSDRGGSARRNGLQAARCCGAAWGDCPAAVLLPLDDSRLGGWLGREHKVVWVNGGELVTGVDTILAALAEGCPEIGGCLCVCLLRSHRAPAAEIERPPKRLCRRVGTQSGRCKAYPKMSCTKQEDQHAGRHGRPPEQTPTRIRPRQVAPSHLIA